MKRGERREKKAGFLQTKRNTVSLREEDKKGGVLALLALLGIKLISCREQYDGVEDEEERKREREK